MNNGFFDDLARTLAAPMPRRGALRTLGAALAIGAFRALGFDRAAGYVGAMAACEPIDCGHPNEKLCCVPVGKYGGQHSTGCCGEPGREDCCIGPNDEPDTPNPMTWCCPKGKCSPSHRAPGGPCRGPDDCNQDKNELLCGKKCCKLDNGEFCGSAKHSLCCQTGDTPCLSGNLGICCKPGKSPCWDATHVDCCDPNQACVKGSCACKPTTTVCGSECCSNTEVCSNGKCCPKGRVNCGGECCEPSRCCSTTAGNKKCCKQGEVCGTIAGAPGNKNCCATSRIVVTASGAPVCCPSGTVDNGKGACCPPGTPNCCAKACAKGTICSAGECVPI